MHFEQYEIAAQLARPWTTNGAGLLRASVRLEAGVGAISGGADVGYYASFGPSMAVGTVRGRVMLDVGSSVAALSDGTLGGRDLGGPIEFISHGGADLRVTHGVCIGYRIQHMSNAGLYALNPGLNMHLVELRAMLP